MPDWFTDNAPAAAGGDDWFAANAPAVPAAMPSSHAAGLSSGWPAKLFDVAGDVLTGAAKGAGQTVTNLGALVHKIPGVDAAVDTLYGKPGLSKTAFAAANEDLAPTNTAQKVGKFGEQVAETVLPGKAITAAGEGLSLAGRMALEGGANAGLAAAQGGNPLIAGAIGAVLPGAGALVGKAAPMLEGQAAKQVMEALGPTKERFKAISERLTPEVLKRGLRGSREDLQAQASTAASDIGDQIDQAIQQFGGRKVGTQPIVAALEEAKNQFRTVTQQDMIDALKAQDAGAASKIVGIDKNGIADVVTEHEPRAIRQLDELQNIIKGLGPDARADHLIAIRRAWDKVVSQAGGFAHRAGGAIGVPLADTTEAAAKREATSAIRAQLDSAVPELSKLNKEFSFWKNLDDVLSQTLQRTQPQKPGLLGAAAEAAGGVVGAAAGLSHGPAGAVGGGFALGKVAKMAQMTFSSPRWKLASAQAKDALAEAITKNDAGAIAMALARIGAVQGSKAGK